MTGFARVEGAHDLCTWVWEAKSVNAKGLDVRLRLPAGFEMLEVEVRSRVKKRFGRGNISLSLNVNWQRSTGAYQVNADTLNRILKILPQIRDQAPDAGPATLDGLLGLRGVIEAIDDPLDEAEKEVLDQSVLDGVDSVLSGLAEGRGDEGKRLAELLSEQLAAIGSLCSKSEDLAALRPAAIKERLVMQVRELADAVPAMPEDRLAQELAMLMLKADVREELDRLASHQIAAKDLMEQAGPIGRQFDFLCQEFNREANTLCSKSSDVALTQVGLELKTVIDQMREQVQNVE